MTSNWRKSSSALALVSRSSNFSTFTKGLMPRTVSSADSSLRRPTSAVEWMICRCRLVKSTTSKSTIPSVPTPAAARYMSSGAPLHAGALAGIRPQRSGNMHLHLCPLDVSGYRFDTSMVNRSSFALRRGHSILDHDPLVDEALLFFSGAGERERVGDIGLGFSD